MKSTDIDPTDGGRLKAFKLGYYRLHRATLGPDGRVDIGKAITCYQTSLADTDGSKPITKTVGLVYLSPGEATGRSVFFRSDVDGGYGLKGEYQPLVLTEAGMFERISMHEAAQLLDADPASRLRREHRHACANAGLKSEPVRHGYSAGSYEVDTLTPWNGYYAYVTRVTRQQIWLQAPDIEDVIYLGLPAPSPLRDWSQAEFQEFLAPAYADGRAI